MRIGLPHMVEVPGEKVELELEISVFIDPGQESVQWMRHPERVLSAGVSVLPSRSPGQKVIVRCSPRRWALGRDFTKSRRDSCRFESQKSCGMQNTMYVHLATVSPAP